MMLPKIAGELYDDFERRTGMATKLQELVDGVKNGNISIDEFVGNITDILADLSEKAKDIMEIVDETNYAAESPDEVETGFEGIDAYEQGLSLFLLYGDQQDPVILDQGMELVTEGNNKINQAIRLNREKRTNLEWDVWV